MISVLDQLAPGSHVAVVRLRSLGDSVLVTPAIHLLKQARPDLEIGVVSEDRFAAVYEGNPDFARILAVSVRALRAFAPDLCINLHGGPRSVRLTALSGAKFRAGFEHFAYQRVYNVHIPRAQEILGVERRVHTAEHAASAMFYLGVEETEIPGARLFATEAAPKLAVPGPYAVLHPFASQPDKTWPAPFFSSVAQHVQRNLDLQPVFLAGSGDDAAAFQVWPVLAGAPLGAVKALLKEAVLFIGNDSGPAHMAAAFGVPAVVLFGSSDPAVWSPWRTPGQVLSSAGGPMHEISEQKVILALDRLRVHA